MRRVFEAPNETTTDQRPGLTGEGHSLPTPAIRGRLSPLDETNDPAPRPASPIDSTTSSEQHACDELHRRVDLQFEIISSAVSFVVRGAF
jgi:hypothetical protein